MKPEEDQNSGFRRKHVGIHLPGIIRMLGEHLYSDKTVAIRELVQNANDSLVRRQIEDPAAPDDLRIKIECTYMDDLLTVRDNGAGMTEREIADYLSTVGRSGTEEFRKALEQRNAEEAHRLIGQFGMGFLSAFTIADSVELRTRSYQRGASGFLWRCDGGTEYYISEIRDVPVGTAVTLHLQREHDQFADEDRLIEIVRRYADFISFPIHFGEARLPVNAQVAPWHAGVSIAEYADYIKTRFDEEPLEVIPLNARTGGVELGGVLFIPQSKSPDLGEVTLYVSRMYVGRDRELLPDWAKFVRGVVETPSLDVTTSRESAVRNAKHRRVQELIADRLERFIGDLARDEPARFNHIVSAHEHAVKMGALESDTFFDLVKDDIRLDSDSGKVTIPKYLERASSHTSEPVRTLYFHTGGVESRQHQLLFAANGVPVLDAEERIDRAFIEKYAQRTKGVRAKVIDEAADVLFDRVKSARFEQLIARYADMDIQAKPVSFKPGSVPALLVRDNEAAPERVLERLRRDREVPDQLRQLFEALVGGRAGMEARGWILYLNTDNEVVQLLAGLKENDVVVRQCMREIYNSAYLVAAKGLSVQEVERMVETHTQTVAMLLRAARALGEHEPARGQERQFWRRLLGE